MDEVRVERLVQKYKESGELDSEDPALLMLKKWPVSKQCKDNAEKLPGLEQQIIDIRFLVGNNSSSFIFLPSPTLSFIILYNSNDKNINILNVFCR